MQAISDLSTRAKLMLGFGLMFGILFALSSIAYRDTAVLKASQQALFKDNLSPVSNVMGLRNAINRERVVLLSMTIADAAEQPELNRQLAQESAEIASIMGKLAFNRTGDANDGAALGQLEKAHAAYSVVRDQQVLPALKAGRRAEASSAVLGPLQQKFVAFRDLADRLSEQQFIDAEQRVHQSEALVDNIRLTFILANVVALLIGLVKVIWLDRVIAFPLKQATLVAGRIAGGDLTVTVPAANGADEVAQLMRALATMVTAWRAFMADRNAGIITLTAAASEILASTMQGAAGAAETAAAVSETSATVEEVKQTALLASQKSRLVSDAAQEASKTASAGRRAIEQGIEGMESIQQKMESIAATIVRLSERSQAIAEIIVTVGGLAEQSNLLAVNAAIEAAKAGEHGKGFSVVAHEVKNLADQSKQATRQVRELLGEIQKAISSAVMLTEQGSKTVANGVEQTSQAGHAIRLLAESIADAAEAAAQIAASSQQQLAGMDQVALAMENINHVSSENAAGSRQAEVSAQNLHELGQKLRHSTELFRI
jgi:methyl-accepting chemotaxis protein